MTVLANSKVQPLLQYLAQVNLTQPPTSPALNLSILLSADIYNSTPGMLTANYGFDGYMGVPGLTGTDDASREAAWQYGVSWQDLDPALNAGVRAYYSAVGDTNFQAMYGVSATLADTIPVVFSHPVLGTSLTPQAFEIELNTGERVTPLAASFLPNGEYNERQTVVLTGYWGNRLQPDDPDALHPVKVRIVETDTPLMLVTEQGLVSIAGDQVDSKNPYVEGNGPRIVRANLDAYSNLGEGAPIWLTASNNNAGSDLFGDEAQFRLRVYTSAGFSPDGIGSILPTEFSRYFQLEATDALGRPVWLLETGVDYAIGGFGTVRIAGIADTGPVQDTYDLSYIEDHDNQYDIILSGDAAAIAQITRVHMPSSGDYSPVYNPGGPGNDPASNPPLPFTVPSSSQSTEVSQLIGRNPYVSFVEIDGSVYRDPVTGQPVGEDQGVAVRDTLTGHTINQYIDPYGRLFYASFQVSDHFDPVSTANHPALFDPVFYLRQNPDVRTATQGDHQQAWDHYLQFGALEAYAQAAVTRAPNPWFDVQFYLNGNPDLARAGLGADDAFLHFAQYGMTELRAPNALSASQPVTSAAVLDYALANPDLQQAFGIASVARDLTDSQEEQLLMHYYRWGYAEDRPQAPTVLTEPATDSVVPADTDWVEITGSLNGAVFP